MALLGPVGIGAAEAHHRLLGAPSCLCSAATRAGRALQRPPTPAAQPPPLALCVDIHFMPMPDTPEEYAQR
eukprot:4522550-Alexandrium_andersonii.AAC.1